MELDRPYNNLGISGPLRKLTLSIPIFGSDTFNTGEEIFENSNWAYGSSAFELASVLQLLPGQGRASSLIAETVSLQELLYDDDTYYSRCSHNDILRFVTQHFVSIREAPGRLILQTDIGLFTFIQTDRKLLIRCNSSERRTGVIAPHNQDYEALRKCVLGQWCLREGDEYNEDSTIDYLIPGPVQKWHGPFDVDLLLLFHNIDHKNCIYFLSQEIYQEIDLWVRFTDDVGEALEWLYEHHPEAFPFMGFAFDFLKKLKRKMRRLTDPQYLGSHISIVRTTLQDAIRKDAPDGSGGSIIDKEVGGDIIARFGEYQLELFEIYRTTPTREALKDKMISSLSDTPELVRGQLGMCRWRGANAQFILGRAVAAPKAWLDLLNAGDGWCYVG
jgi:hypothetical protein